METPPSADLSKLKNMLSGARNIMNKVESGNFETGHVDSRALNETGIQEMMNEGTVAPQTTQQHQSVAPQIDNNGQGMYKNISTSKMPTAIKEAMINNPVPQVSGPNHTFNAEDVSDMIPQTQQYPSTPKTRRNQQPVHEGNHQKNDMITVSETALRGIIKDVLLEFMTDTFTQNLKEDVIKKTIGTLIKEGKIAVKKKRS